VKEGKQVKKLQGKWAFVTGSSRGIGQQIAMGLANEGCNVIVHGRTLENTKQTIEILSSYEVKTDVVYGELTSIDDINRMISEIKLKYEIDILYNNAGIQNKWKEIWDLSIEAWQEVFQINLFSMVLFCNAFIPDMKKNNYGRVINLSSGIKDIPQMAPYSASKAAVDKYTFDLAFELRNTNVLVNCVDPGWLRTDLGGQYAPNDVKTVLPGVLVPALLDNDGKRGHCFSAQEYHQQS